MKIRHKDALCQTDAVLEFPRGAAVAKRLRGVADLIHRAAVHPDPLTRSLALEVARRRADALAELLTPRRRAA